MRKQQGGPMLARCFLSLMALVCLSLAAPAAQAPNRTQAPKPGPPPVLKLPEVQKRALGNGVPVRIVEMHEVPVVQVSLVVTAGGGTADPDGKEGVASMTAAMLDEGAGGRTALEIADAIEHLGASLSTTSSFDASAVRLWVPVARLAEALPVMADVALRPTFDPQELERLRKERLTAMLQARDDPPSIASLALPRIVFGGHRYGTSLNGTPETVGAMNQADLTSFYRSHYRPDRSTLIVVGDVRADAVLAEMEKAFGGWKAEGTAPPEATLPMAAQLAKRQVHLIDKPGAAQSVISIGGVGVPRSTPDYFALQVLNTVLGGSFTSRLNYNLREQHGYTYGARSGFAMRRSAGPFSASAAVQTEVTGPALTEFFKELNGILQSVPPEELQRAKNYLALQFPGEFETTGEISANLEEAVVYNLPEDYFSNYIGRIQAVTAEDVKRAADRYILPGRFAVVVVGDRKMVEAQVRALNLGPVNVLSVDQALGPAK